MKHRGGQGTMLVHRAGAWHVIDFGLARRFVDEEGGVLAAREEAAFRGSTSYASINAHKQQDLGQSKPHPAPLRLVPCPAPLPQPDKFHLCFRCPARLQSHTTLDPQALIGNLMLARPSLCIVQG